MFQDLARRAHFIVSRGWFPLLWSFIGVVSAIDTYLVVRFRDLMWHLEENPMGRYLIALNDGNIAVFVRTKAAGTVVVLSVLAGLFIYRRQWSFPITASIAAFQLRLLVYVALSAPVDPSLATSNSNVAVDGSARPRSIWDDVYAYLPNYGWQPDDDSVRFR